jgi:hypothetical protein
MQKLARAFTILTLVFLVRLVFSCCNCTEQEATYQFDHLLISNINNAEWTANQTDFDVMYDEAVAFRMTLIDSSSTEYHLAQNRRPALTGAMAMQPCECPWHFFIRHEISEFSVISLRDFSTDKPAGTDISSSFVFQTGWNHLYVNIDSLIPRLNLDYISYEQPKKVIDLFCKDRVENDSLQLVFQIHFVNGDVIADTSNVIAIRKSGEEGRP